MSCPRPGKECNEVMCGGNHDRVCTVDSFVEPTGSKKENKITKQDIDSIAMGAIKVFLHKLSLSEDLKDNDLFGTLCIIDGMIYMADEIKERLES